MNPLARLDAALGDARWTIAVSGGVDSMTLATLAHRRLTHPPRMVHATSPAVPAAARAIVEHHASAEGWTLDVIDAGEFADPAYRANPYDRCYFCKSRLYAGVDAVLAAVGGDGPVASGTNLDDLGDVRPGLRAAAERGVRHPYVEARIDKNGVRALARAFDLPFAELPAQPCLASRVETGIPIDAADLAFIDGLEAELRMFAPAATMRVRLRRAGAAVETDCHSAGWSALEAIAAAACRATGRAFLGMEGYRMGSAFRRPGA